MGGDGTDGETPSRGEEDLAGKHWKRNYVAFWALGLINNFHYCLVLSAASNIADQYHLKKYVALVSWANVFGGLFVRLLNAFVYSHISYNVRFLVGGLQTIFGIVLVSASHSLGSDDTFRFAVALLGVFFCGNGSSYGESVALGYIGSFPPKLVGAWSAGTGMSGVLASLIYLGLSAASLSNGAIFLLSLPLVGVYWSMYFFVLVVRVSTVTVDTDRSADNEEILFTSNWLSTSWAASSSQTSSGSTSGRMSVREKLLAWKRGNWANLKVLHGFILFNNLNLMLVYVAEYAAQFMAPFAFPCELVKHSGNFFIENSYVITQFCYQVGVLCSRSSLSCVRIRRVSILTAVQLVNAVLWFIQAKSLVMSSSSDVGSEEKFAFALFGYMVFVGLFGGASYVNVFYNILEQTQQTTCTAEASGGQERDSAAANCRTEQGPREGAENDVASLLAAEPGSGQRRVMAGQGTQSDDAAALKAQRELCMNIGALYAVAGITLGSMLDVLFSNTILDRSC